MSHLKTIDTIKALKGKLNFLKINNQSTMDMLRFANSINSKSEASKLNNISVQEIEALGSNTSMSSWKHKKMLFDLHVHKNANPSAPNATIYEELDKHQKNIVRTLLSYTDSLNSRQLLYLNYAIRQRIQSVLPNWDNLHLNPESPSRRDMQLIPTITGQKDLIEVKTIQKKRVIAAISKVQEEAKRAEEQN